MSTANGIATSLEALLLAAIKRRIIDPAAASRIAAYARNTSLDNATAVRTWVTAESGLAPRLAEQLTELLPKPEEEQLGGYRLLAHLADGGMGRAWIATGDNTNMVVIKTQHARLMGNHEEMKQRFMREAKIMRSLDHPHVVRCLDAGDNGKNPPTLFMALEFVDSGDLKDLIQAHGRLSEALTVSIIRQIALALEMAAQQKLIHRDIKPANIFVGSTGFAKLADFGVARSTSQDRTALTMQGAVVGSPHYMAPEQIMGDPDIDGSIDIYALGTVAYACLSGDVPFTGSVQDVLHAHCTKDRPDITGVVQTVSEDTANLIRTAMAIEKKNRYATPKLLADDCARILEKLGHAANEIVGLPKIGPTEDATPTLNLIGGGGDGTDVTMAAVPGGAFNRSDETGLTIAGGIPGDGSDTDATMVANLGTGADESAVLTAVANPSFDTNWQEQSSLISLAPDDRFEGSIAHALAAPWIALVPTDGSQPHSIHLYAQPVRLLGKLLFTASAGRKHPTPVKRRKSPSALSSSST